MYRAFTKDMLFIVKLSRRIFYSFLVVTCYGENI